MSSTSLMAGNGGGGAAQHEFDDGNLEEVRVHSKLHVSNPSKRLARQKSDIEVDYNCELAVSSVSMTDELPARDKLEPQVSVEMSALAFFAVEHGISGQEQVGSVSPAPATTQAQSEYTMDMAKHGKKQKFFYLFEADYFPSEFLRVTTEQLLQHCPLRPMPQFGGGGALDEEQQMERAIQESLMMAHDEQPAGHGKRTEMVQLQHAGGADGLPRDAMDAMLRMDPSLQALEPAQRRKAMKQRLKAQEEATFQESIRDLSEMDKSSFHLPSVHFSSATLFRQKRLHLVL